MKAQSLVLLCVCALGFFAAVASATDATVDESGYPPVVFTYNATVCMGCRANCVAANPGPQKRAARRACFQQCQKQEACTHYVPAEYKPETSQQIIVLNSTDFTIPTPAPIEYHTVDFGRAPPVGEFFQKLREYIKWKDAQENSPYQNPAEWKGEDTVVTLTPVGALPTPGTGIPEFGDLEAKPLPKGRKPRKPKTKKPTTPATPAPAPAPVADVPAATPQAPVAPAPVTAFF